MAERLPIRTVSIAGQLSTLYWESDQLYLDHINSISLAESSVSTSNSTIIEAQPMDNEAIANTSTAMMPRPYEIRTLNENNMARMLVLPAFPPDSLRSSTVTTTDAPSETVHLLLANVLMEQFTDEQFARIRRHAYVPLFKLGMAANVISNSEAFETCLNNSYMWDFYEQMYVNSRKRFKVDTSVIDYNLKRLNSCLTTVAIQHNLHRTMLTHEEMLLALEFYLQIDVDMFFLKTCSFNSVEPRFCFDRYRESLFCIDLPEARFAITPCHNRHCTCCHPPCPRPYATNEEQNQPVCFLAPQIHQFANGYEAILNCPATCLTTDCIYVLTCPCGKFDYIGASDSSFAKVLTYHREEGNRIMREFFLGANNIDYLTHGLKSDQKRINDQAWLYQHSTRCPTALQLFLDENPDYWCFVPTRLIGVNLANAAYQRSPSSRRSSINSPSLILSDEAVSSRDHHEIRHLLQNIPKPPPGFVFSVQQRQQQAQFFQSVKDCVVPRDLPDLYNAAIVAVLQANSTELLLRFVESLFITHTECKLNQTGSLVYEKTDPNVALSIIWCADLRRRPLQHL